MLIADELRSLRAKKDVSIVEVASKTSINKDTIVRYENGLVSANVDILDKLLTYYEMEFDIFFTLVCANKHKEEISNEKEPV